MSHVLTASTSQIAGAGSTITIYFFSPASADAMCFAISGSFTGAQPPRPQHCTPLPIPNFPSRIALLMQESLFSHDPDKAKILAGLQILLTDP